MQNFVKQYTAANLDVANVPLDDLALMLVKKRDDLSTPEAVLDYFLQVKLQLALRRDALLELQLQTNPES